MAFVDELLFNPWANASIGGPRKLSKTDSVIDNIIDAVSIPLTLYSGARLAEEQRKLALSQGQQQAERESVPVSNQPGAVPGQSFGSQVNRAVTSLSGSTMLLLLGGLAVGYAVLKD